jgi:hypothetical protein
MGNYKRSHIDVLINTENWNELDEYIKTQKDAWI